jgi:hypothetical protein
MCPTAPKNPSARRPTWDFFIAHTGPDRKAAESLRDCLEAKKATRVYLDSSALAGGDLWQSRLKGALSASRVSVVLISSHTPKAWYQQEEVVLAIELSRKEYVAHTIVPVYLKAARANDTPYGLRRLHALREDSKGMQGIANELMRTLKQRRRGGTEALAGSVRRMDELWSEAEPAYDGGTGIPKQHRRSFVLDNDDLVSRDHGHELKRITRQGLRRKLGAEEMEYIAVLERSMEVNTALWKTTHPRRTISSRDRTRAKAAVTAMSGDLRAVLDAIERAGFELDDHYQMIRNIVGGSSAAGR